MSMAVDGAILSGFSDSTLTGSVLGTGLTKGLALAASDDDTGRGLAAASFDWSVFDDADLDKPILLPRMLLVPSMFCFFPGRESPSSSSGRFTGDASAVC